MAKGAASGATSLLPYIGDVKDAQEVITGRDLIAGKKLSKGERIVTGAVAILPAVSGPMLRTVGKGAKIAAKEAPKAIKSAEKAGSKAVKKAAPKVITKADDIIKAAQKAVIKREKQ
ncbi:pre-toxin TG domain-containing protein [[Clostridium] polysaccharolyticum]|uniref:Pre-toxin TG n=1 Tax=[Clostridium] polysaccharolyticum TaxID=29364 RepID=A0A1I0DFP0_9FIRM|nr:pre-toxin TG domain-containing protein [[Clostridium] polysaccharolyticum]SET31208.1 Pre-toxin TG [[Clostridium] polysaccharolyticum]